MIDQFKTIQCLKNNGIEFITGVPDTLLNDFCINIESEWNKDKHVIAANEGNAIGLAAGYYLATGSIPLVYMQNSGIGNALNPLISLTHPTVYGIPMILLIGWRGEPGVNDHPQHKKQGELTPVLMNDLDIPYLRLVDNFEEVEKSFEWAVLKAKEISGPVALLVPKGVLERGEKSGFEDQPGLMSREEAINCILDALPNDTIYVASTGRATRELFEVRRLRGESHNNDFLNVGAMGHTSSIAAGIALANKNKMVVCLDGDAAAIMHLGAMAIIGQRKELQNFMHIVLNNGVHESVGGQNSVGFSVNLTGIAENSGYTTVGKYIINKDELNSSLQILLKKELPGFLEFRIKKGIRSNMPPLNFGFLTQK